MSKKGKVWALVALFFALSLWGMWEFATGEHVIRLTQSEIQEKLNAKLPQTVSGVTVKQVTVALGDNVLRLHIEADAKKFGQAFETSTDVVGRPVYVPVSGEFYLRPTETVSTRVSVNGKSIAEGTEDLLRYVNMYLNAERMLGNREAIGKSAEERLTAVFESAATRMLRTQPVYTLPSTGKGMLARAVLSDVAVESETLVIKLSLLQLTFSVALCILGVLVALAGAVLLVTAPELVLAFVPWF